MLTNDMLTHNLRKANHSFGDNSLCIEKEKPYKNEKKGRRAMSWSQLLLPSYKTRLIEFRKQFKKMPATERLIDDFACALQKEILIQGRIYVSANYLNFHANIFGWETVVEIRLCDITTVMKAYTIRVIPNAIQVVTNDGSKYIFTSFVARDRAFKRIYRLWQDTIIGTKMSVSEMWQLIHYNYGSDLGISSDESANEQVEVDHCSIIQNNNLKIKEEIILDDVFPENTPLIFKRRDSANSFRTCPESEVEDFNSFNYEDIVRSLTKHHNSHNLAKLKYWFASYPRESLYIRLLLILTLLLLFMHLIILYKLSNVDISNYVNIRELKQVADITSRLARDTNYFKL